MKKLVLFILVVIGILHPVFTEAQYFYSNEKYYYNSFTAEAGISIGLMNALTDLGGKKGIGKSFIKDLNFRTSQFCAGGYLALNYKDAVTIKLEGTFGKLTGYDSILKNVKASTFGRYERNLSFQTKITDFMLAAEIHPLFFKADWGNDEPPKISPYAVFGIGFFSFNPQAKLNGLWIDLQPLRTEGQGFTEYSGNKIYKLKQINIPIGMGVRFEISSVFNTRIELVHRILRTDYLDDVSTKYIDPSLFSAHLPAGLAALSKQLYDRRGELSPNVPSAINNKRGDSKDNDAYFSLQIKVGYTFRQRRKMY
jgi:hypothetical protein